MCDMADDRLTLATCHHHDHDFTVTLWSCARQCGEVFGFVMQIKTMLLLLLRANVLMLCGIHLHNKSIRLVELAMLLAPSSRLLHKV